MPARRAAIVPAIAAVVTALVVLSPTPARAAPPSTEPGTGTALIGLASDAWYSTAPSCTANPSGCLPAGAPATSPYPAKTLHVGVSAGLEESRSYLALDLGALPAGTALIGGTLLLPVGPAQDGSRLPQTATLQACLVTAAFSDSAEGATDPPPAVDCKRATAAAQHLPAEGGAPEMFTIDLSPFAVAWADGAPNDGLVLLPAANTPASSAWHIALSAHDQPNAGNGRITATVSFASTAASGTFRTAPNAGSAQLTPAPPAAADSVGLSAGSSTGSLPDPALLPGIAPQLLPTPVVQPQAVPQGGAPALQPQAFTHVRGYDYPMVFLLPLLLAVAGGWLARAFTRDLTPN